MYDNIDNEFNCAFYLEKSSDETLQQRRNRDHSMLLHTHKKPILNGFNWQDFSKKYFHLFWAPTDKRNLFKQYLDMQRGKDEKISSCDILLYFFKLDSEDQHAMFEMSSEC